MPPTFKIHPAVGVARVGDSPEPGYIGPEQPGVPANWNFETAAFNKFKDAQGRIKRQGSRFRIFKYDESGVTVGEVLPGQDDVVSIEWTVHVANRKASYYEFHGPSGENGDYTKNPLRNNDVAESQRASLDIDPGPRTISGRSTAPIPLTNPNDRMNRDIPDLGDISTDADGRLVFFGGHGNFSQQGPDIDDYVNNDGWFDDVSDGPVTAVIVFANGARVAAAGAWVCVGPPDFAPAIGNVVTLYELMWDLAVQTPSIPIPALAMFRAGGALEALQRQRDDWDPTRNRFKTFQPSYVNDIAPLLERALNAMYVHAPKDVNGFHNTIGPQVWADLGSLDPLNAQFRQKLFDKMRDPDTAGPPDSNEMPRGLGDQYFDERDPEEDPSGRTNPKRFFALTRVQYAMLERWKDGNFIPGDGPPAISSTPLPITPEGLDRAALENCVGGPFFPGIEVSWTARNPKIFIEPFRVVPGVTLADRVLTGPGFLTQSMAVPWQADFRECKKEELTNTVTGERSFAMWWAAQRPDDVFPEDDPDNQVAWARAPHFPASDTEPERFKDMVKGWPTLGFVARRTAEGKWLETERKP